MTGKRRSKLERDFEIILQELGVEYNYEKDKIEYIIPESNHNYLIDWSVNNHMYIETKGYLSDHAERTKYILVKKQHPNLDLRFVFANCNKPCGGMKMTHGQWAEKYGFKYCSIKDYETIKEWVNNENPSHS